MYLKKLSPKRFSVAVLLVAMTAISGYTAGFSILVIGDSNTENGYITLALADTLRKYSGGDTMGTGYIPLDSSFYELRDKRVPGVSVGYPLTWTLYDMFEWTRIAEKPYLSPNGQWLRSTTTGALSVVTFPGNGVDVYWLATSTGGSFTITIDNVLKDTVQTGGPTGVRKTAITGLTKGKHTMVFKVTSLGAGGSVTLLGFDAHSDIAGQTKRAVVHNWGNGWSSTMDFLNIDSTIFATGLQQLEPDIVVVLLGTNDHLQDTRSAASLKTNLVAIVNRIKAAGFAPKTLLVSTFMTDNTSGTTYVPQYRSISWPGAATETGVKYWDMSTWYGNPNPVLMLDGNHCNAAGGKKIAAEMLKQIIALFPPTATTNPATAEKRSSGPLTCRGGVLSVGEADAPFKIQLFSVSGRLVSQVCGYGRFTGRIGEGVLRVPEGVYVVKAAIGSRRYALPSLTVR